MVSNTYGIVPLESDNAYIKGGFSYQNKISKDIYYNLGVDLVGRTSESSSFFVEQLYGELGYKFLLLSIGPKERYTSMLDKELSSGNFGFSTNALPIPEINLSMPAFTALPFTKEILKIKGDFMVGKATDDNYVLSRVAPKENYIIDVLYHRMSFWFSLEDPKQHFPLTFMFGFEHDAQWGGTKWMNNRGWMPMPHSFSDFIRIVLGESGDQNATESDQINVLGNHLGTYNIKFGYKHKDFTLGLYKQHYFDDNSGMEYANWRDGIWGAECFFNNQPYLKKIVLEYINTTNQSGPLHFLNQDIPNSRGGGADNYYNNGDYIIGWSHWGRVIGNPLITSTEYNGAQNGLYLKNNRVKALHLGLSGDISPNLSYRTLFTGMYAWGTMGFPFLEKKHDFSSLIESTYHNASFPGWSLGLQLAFDCGTLYEDNLGVSIKIAKTLKGN